MMMMINEHTCYIHLQQLNVTHPLQPIDRQYRLWQQKKTTCTCLKIKKLTDICEVLSVTYHEVELYSSPHTEIDHIQAKGKYFCVRALMHKQFQTQEKSICSNSHF